MWTAASTYRISLKTRYLKARGNIEFVFACPSAEFLSTKKVFRMFMYMWDNKRVMHVKYCQIT